MRSFIPLAILAVAHHASAQQAAPSIIAAEARGYRFDLARNFFSSPEAEIAARPQITAAAAEVEALSGRIRAPAALLRVFQAEDRMQRLFRRHDLYLFLRYAIDIRREDGMQAAEALRAKVRGARQALRRAVASLDRTWLERAARKEPALVKYGFWIETIRRDAPHLLKPEQQAVVNAINPALGAGDYPRIVNAINFGTIEVGGRTLDVRANQSEIEAHASAEVRRRGAEKLLAGYASQRDLFAHMIGRARAASSAVARLRGFDGALEEAAFERYVTRAQIEAMFAAIARHAPTYKKWQGEIVAPNAVPGRWTPSQAIAAVVASAEPLGPIYQQEFADLLRRENGRADFAGGDNRLPLTGTSSVYPTGKSAIYMENFEGVLIDLIVLAHEGGHAVQAQLMHRDGVPMAYAAGPGYFTESFGRFQELLLLDRLHRTATAPADRRRFRDALASRLFAVFPSAEESAIDIAIEKAVAAEGALTADALDALTSKAGSPYSLEYQRSPGRRGLWQLGEGYYLYPLQGLDNPLASLLAIRYFTLYRRDPERFRADYLRLLSGGYDAAPGDLLKRHLGLDMMADGFAEETLRTLEEEIARLYPAEGSR